MITEQSGSAHLHGIARMRELEARQATISQRRTPVFRSRNQLTPIERRDALLDSGMPYLRLHALANYLVDSDDPDTSVPGASVYIGIGFVSGVRCIVWVDDSGIKAGAMTSSSLPVVLSALEMAKRQKLPVVHLVESAGVNLMEYEVEGWHRFGEVFYRMAQLSAQGVPIVTVLHGMSTAGGAYMPGMSDYVIGVRDNGTAALAGAALVLAATGEQSTDQELGGAAMHAETTGLVEYLVDDDREGVARARQVMAHLHWNKSTSFSHHVPEYPESCSSTMLDIIPTDPHQAYDAMQIVSRVVDAGSCVAFKSRYGPSTLCLRATVSGHHIGIIANNGPIDAQGAAKTGHFLQLCDAADTPVVFFSNTTGYMVGVAAERAGMIKHGAKMIQAVSNVRVPRITFYVGASFGAGNYGMSGHSYKPDFCFAWTTARTGVMGGEQAAKTMEQVTVSAAKRRGRPIDSQQVEAQRNALLQRFHTQTDPFYTSGRVLDHGMIDPRDTRRVLLFALETCREARARPLNPNAFGVSRF